MAALRSTIGFGEVNVFVNSNFGGDGFKKQ